MLFLLCLQNEAMELVLDVAGSAAGPLAKECAGAG
jgi:hypothetical protein